MPGRRTATPWRVAPNPSERVRNAQDEEQERRQKALLVHRHGQSEAQPGAQAPRDVEAPAEDDPSGPRPGSDERARHGARAQILPAERPLARENAAWPASNGGSPPTPGTRRS